MKAFYTRLSLALITASLAACTGGSGGGGGGGSGARATVQPKPENLVGVWRRTSQAFDSMTMLADDEGLFKFQRGSSKEEMSDVAEIIYLTLDDQGVYNETTIDAITGKVSSLDQIYEIDKDQIIVKYSSYSTDGRKYNVYASDESTLVLGEDRMTYNYKRVDAQAFAASIQKYRVTETLDYNVSVTGKNGQVFESHDRTNSSSKEVMVSCTEFSDKKLVISVIDKRNDLHLSVSTERSKKDIEFQSTIGSDNQPGLSFRSNYFNQTLPLRYVLGNIKNCALAGRIGERKMMKIQIDCDTIQESSPNESSRIQARFNLECIATGFGY